MTPVALPLFFYLGCLEDSKKRYYYCTIVFYRQPQLCTSQDLKRKKS